MTWLLLDDGRRSVWECYLRFAAFWWATWMELRHFHIAIAASFRRMKVTWGINCLILLIIDASFQQLIILADCCCHFLPPLSVGLILLTPSHGRLLFPLLSALSDGRWLLQLFTDRRLSTGAGASRLLSLLYDGAATASCLLNCCNGYLTNLFNWISYFSIHLFQLILLRCLSCSSFDTGSTSMAAVEQAWLQ